MTDTVEELQATIEELRKELARYQWQDAADAPKGVPVLVSGGLAMQKTGGQWFTGMEDPIYQRPIEWKVDKWMHLPKVYNEE